LLNLLGVNVEYTPHDGDVLVAAITPRTCEIIEMAKMVCFNLFLG